MIKVVAISLILGVISHTLRHFSGKNATWKINHCSLVSLVLSIHYLSTGSLLTLTITIIHLSHILLPFGIPFHMKVLTHLLSTLLYLSHKLTILRNLSFYSSCSSSLTWHHFITIIISLVHFHINIHAKCVPMQLYKLLFKIL